MANVKLQEHIDHYNDLIKQRNNCMAKGNYRKVRDLNKGINRVWGEIMTCKRYLKERERTNG